MHASFILIYIPYIIIGKIRQTVEAKIFSASKQLYIYTTT